MLGGGGAPGAQTLPTPAKIGLNNPNEKSQFLKPTSVEEIKYLILSLNPNKSSGLSSFPTKILKYIADIISKPLCDLVNMSISNGFFPDTFKTAEVIPVF